MNSDGQLGTGNFVTSSSPLPVGLPGGMTFNAVAGGADFSLAVSTSGQVYAWGANEAGQLGNGTMPAANVTPAPVNLPGGVAVTGVAAGIAHSLAVTSTGAVYAWGWNDAGELGNGSTALSTLPVSVNLPAGVTVTAVATGLAHSLALSSTGRVYAWGDNTYGQLGDGTTTNRLTPVPVALPDGLTFTAIAASNHFSLALSSTGRVYAWGDNAGGNELGAPTVLYSATPLLVGLPNNVAFTAIAAGAEYGLALSTGGNLYAWGSNVYGQLGLSPIGSGSPPVAVPLPAGLTFTSIAAGRTQSLAISSVLIPNPIAAGGGRLSFGYQVLNTSSVTRTMTITSVGYGALVISGLSVAGANPSDFMISADTCTGASVAQDIGACTFAVTFTPSAIGFRQAYVAVSDNAANSPQILSSLRGSGSYSWSGVLQPINADGSSIFHLGRTVPVKFQLTGTCAGITNAVATLTVAQISNGITGTYQEPISTAAADSGNTFRYDSTSNQYVFNLDTSSLTAGTWQLSINLGDGIVRAVDISLG